LETQVHSLENAFTVGDLHYRRNGVGEYKKLTTYSIEEINTKGNVSAQNF